jgi:hypothetical protein
VPARVFFQQAIAQGVRTKRDAMKACMLTLAVGAALVLAAPTAPAVAVVLPSEQLTISPDTVNAALNTGTGRLYDDQGKIDCSLKAGVTTGTCSASYDYPPSAKTLTVKFTEEAAPGTWACISPKPSDCASKVDWRPPQSFNLVLTAGQPYTNYLDFGSAPQVTVRPLGSGAGKITSSPAGIDCPTDCAENTFDYHQNVVLRAKPDPGSVFAGWLNGCSGPGSTCSITYTVDVSVDAVFYLAPAITTGSTILPGTGTVYVDGRLLKTGEKIPFGQIVDAKSGTVVLQTRSPSGTIQRMRLSGGVFKLLPLTGGRVKVVLTGGNFGACARKRARLPAAVSPKRTVIRHLNANGKGPVRVVARHASTEDLGTVWDTIDRCDGTEVRVKRGAVKVTDLIRHKTRKVTAGHAIVVRP